MKRLILSAILLNITSLTCFAAAGAQEPWTPTAPAGRTPVPSTPHLAARTPVAYTPIAPNAINFGAAPAAGGDNLLHLIPAHGDNLLHITPAHAAAGAPAAGAEDFPDLAPATPTHTGQ